MKELLFLYWPIIIALWTQIGLFFLICWKKGEITLSINYSFQLSFIGILTALVLGPIISILFIIDKKGRNSLFYGLSYYLYSKWKPEKLTLSKCLSKKIIYYKKLTWRFAILAPGYFNYQISIIKAFPTVNAIFIFSIRPYGFVVKRIYSEDSLNIEDEIEQTVLSKQSNITHLLSFIKNSYNL